MKKPKPVVNQSPLSYHRKHRLYDPSSGKEPIKVKVYLHMYVSHTEAYTNEAAAKYYLEWYANKPEIITEVEILLEEWEGELQ